MSDRDVPQPLSTSELWVAGFTAVYMLVSLIFSIVRGNSEFIFYLLVMCVLITVAVVVHRSIQLHIAALWGLAIWGLAHMCGGLMPIPESWPIEGDQRVLYNLWLMPDQVKYDQVVHAFGFGLVTWICWQGLCRGFRRHGIEILPSLGWLTLCIAAGMGFGAANEVVEFAATLSLPNTNVGGYINTGWDLVSNLVGCVIAASMVAWLHRPEAESDNS